MKLSISPQADPNYLADIVKCPEPKPHPFADRLEILTIFGCDTIVAKGCYVPGEKLVYFPVESCVANKYLSWANLYTNSALNRNPTNEKNGYFESKGRVRAIKLRNFASQGFLVPVKDIADCYGVSPDIFEVGYHFDTIGEEVLITKYNKGDASRPNAPRLTTQRRDTILDKIILKLPNRIRVPIHKTLNKFRNRNEKEIIEGCFKFHGKTEHLGRNIHAITPNTSIVVSSKLHGTSAIFGKVLCKKKGIRAWFSSDKTEYKFVYSSRTIIKNKKHDKFTDDVWGVIAESLKDKIPDGYSVYGEIVGYTPSGKMIQKNYDYHVAPGQCKFYVYRITFEVDGEVFELDWEGIEDFCMKEGLETVPVIYRGYADKLFPEIENDNWWHDNFLVKLKEAYLDKPCELCSTDVINEGIVLRDEYGRGAFKFKSPKFLLKETEERDAGESNIEEDS